jgi:hypothetical protein
MTPPITAPNAVCDKSQLMSKGECDTYRNVSDKHQSACSRRHVLLGSVCLDRDNGRVKQETTAYAADDFKPDDCCNRRCCAQVYVQSRSNGHQDGSRPDELTEAVKLMSDNTAEHARDGFHECQGDNEHTRPQRTGHMGGLKVKGQVVFASNEDLGCVRSTKRGSYGYSLQFLDTETQPRLPDWSAA